MNDYLSPDDQHEAAINALGDRFKDKHTQGEWKIVTSPDRHPLQHKKFYTLLECPRNDSSIAICYGDSVEECEANSKLIAAAPELLEALQRVNHTLYAHGKVEDETELHRFIEAAIKKATE